MDSNQPLPDDENLRPFPFERLEKKTDDYLAKIRAEARRIADEAKMEIVRFRRETEAELAEREESLRADKESLDRRASELDRREKELSEEAFQSGREAGFASGREEGVRQGLDVGRATAEAESQTRLREELAKKLDAVSDSCLPTLQLLVGQLENVRQSLLARWEENILQIAAAIAYQTIGRDLPRFPELPLDLLRESLELAVGCSTVKIRMNPKDLETLRGQIERLLAEFSELTTTELTPDAKISPGGCVVETSLGTIDQRLESRLERIISELSQ